MKEVFWKCVLKYEESSMKELAFQKQLAEELAVRRRGFQELVPQPPAQPEEPSEEERLLLNIGMAPDEA